MNDDSQMLLMAYDGVMDGTCTLAQAMEIVAILGAAPTPSLSVSAPSSSSGGNGSDLLDFLDAGAPLNLDVWSTPALAVPYPKVAESMPSFSFAPPPAPVPSTLFDPFDSDPFGPGTSSIDDLLASPPAVVSPIPDLFGGMSSGQAAFQGHAQSGYLSELMSSPVPGPVGVPAEMSPVTSVKKTVDLNALIFSHNNNNAFQGHGFGQEQQYQQQQQQQQYQQQQQQQQQYLQQQQQHIGGSPWRGPGPTSPISTPDASFQYPYPTLQQSPYQQQQYSTSPPVDTSFFPQNMYGAPPVPSVPPPLPTSAPPAAPQNYQNKPNLFDSF